MINDIGLMQREKGVSKLPEIAIHLSEMVLSFESIKAYVEKARAADAEKIIFFNGSGDKFIITL